MIPEKPMTLSASFADNAVWGNVSTLSDKALVWLVYEPSVDRTYLAITKDGVVRVRGLARDRDELLKEYVREVVE